MQRHHLLSILTLAGLSTGCLPDLPEWAGDTSALGNQRPQIQSVTIDPENPTVQDTVQVLVEVTDPDGDDISLNYTWLVNGEPVGDSDETLVGAKFFQKGDTLKVEVTPYDDIGAGNSASTATEVQNSAPTEPLVNMTQISRCQSLVVNEGISVDMPNHAGMSIDADFTLETWMFVHSAPPPEPEQSSLIMFHGTAENLGFRLGLAGTTENPVLELTLPDGTTESTSSDSPIEMVEWQHVVLIHEYPYWGIYLNGERVLSHETLDAEMPNDAMPLRFGAYSSINGFDGGFYSIRFSEENLYSGEGESFDYQQSRYSMLRPTDRTIGLWLMGPEPSEVSLLEKGESKTYQVLVDHSPNNHDIRVQNGTWVESCPGINVQDIRCEALDSVDHDGDFISYEFEWSLDGGDFTAYPINPSVQDAWYEEILGWTKISCSVRATDKEDQSEWVVQGFDQSASQ